MGDGPERARLESRAQLLGPSVSFVGIANGGRPGHYRGADIYLCSTMRASFGVTLLEAMACGTPLVLSDIPAFREVSQGSGAVFVPPGDAVRWSDAVCDLIDDCDRRALMAASGPEVAQQHAWPVVARRVLEVYRRVTG